MGKLSINLILLGVHPASWFAKNVSLRRPGELGVVLNYQKAAGSVAGMQLVFDVFTHVGWKLGAHLDAWANSVFKQRLWNELENNNATMATMHLYVFYVPRRALKNHWTQVFWRLWGAWFHVTLDCPCLMVSRSPVGGQMHRGQPLGIGRICMTVFVFSWMRIPRIQLQSSRLDVTWYIDTSICAIYIHHFFLVHSLCLRCIEASVDTALTSPVHFVKAKINGGLLGSWNTDMPDQAPESQSFSVEDAWVNLGWGWKMDLIGDLKVLDGSLEICWRLFLGNGVGVGGGKDK